MRKAMIDRTLPVIFGIPAWCMAAATVRIICTILNKVIAIPKKNKVTKL